MFGVSASHQNSYNTKSISASKELTEVSEYHFCIKTYHLIFVLNTNGIMMNGSPKGTNLIFASIVVRTDR